MPKAVAIAFLHSLAVAATGDAEPVADNILMQISVGSTWPRPQADCAGIRTTFDAGFGGCDVYTSSRNNHQFCHRDFDEGQGFYAAQVCSECLVCQALPQDGEKAAEESAVEQAAKLKRDAEQEKAEAKENKAEAEREATEKAWQEEKDKKLVLVWPRGAAAQQQVTSRGEREAKEEEKNKALQEATEAENGAQEAKRRAEEGKREAEAAAVRRTQADAAKRQAEEAERKAGPEQRKAEADRKVQANAKRKAEAEGAAKEKDEQRAEAERKAEAKAEAVAARLAEAVRKAQAAAQAAAKEDAAAKAPKAAKEERPSFEPPTLPAARHWRDEQDTAQEEVAQQKFARKETAAKAVGDPHLVNMHGQRFDILREGNHTLIQIPRYAGPRATLLKVDGEALYMGGACADMYFHSIAVKGKWAEDLADMLSKGQSRSDGFDFFTNVAPKSNSTDWMRFGNKLDLKIVWGRTITGVRYLNIFVKHLAAVQASVGGLLGEDDHSTIATPPAGCGRTNSLLSIGSRMGAGVSQGDGTFDELAQVTHEFDYQ
ncbi:unnamed protein product [Prorocentrum cordatum]|uniref:Uncharacterized protein n=1 Tax=Prorocentrum cordatum TaxID=2364126 RepID=A0ABN9T300_9DINO|nr:unnamed protein product [Polarella glacialis]